MSDRVRRCYQRWESSSPTRRAGSQSAFARAIGVDPPRLSEWLSGKKHPTLENLIAVACAANVHVEWLATGRGPERLTEVAGGEPLEVAFHRHVVQALFVHHNAIASRHESAWAMAFQHAHVPSRLTRGAAIEMATRDLMRRLGLPDDLLARATKHAVGVVLSDVESWIERTEEVETTLRTHESARRLLKP